ncbi:MAG: hypothetical protein M3132_03200 [Actinomycetia bacterium]|nr:hypothetical protein [Actinomycetes bacterium]
MLRGLQMPIDWTIFGWPDVPRLGGVTCTTGDPMWAWDAGAPAFGINVFDPPHGIDVGSFRIDHVVLLVPELSGAIATLARVGLDVRLRMKVNERPAAFFRVGPVLEVIESPVREAVIYGVALTTELSLETLALEWRGRGLNVGNPKAAMQPGRRIMTIHGLDAGCAVMSNDRAVDPRT